MRNSLQNLPGGPRFRTESGVDAPGMVRMSHLIAKGDSRINERKSASDPVGIGPWCVFLHDIVIIQKPAFNKEGSPVRVLSHGHCQIQF